MRQLSTSDPNFRVKLTTALVPLELVDDSGRVVGNYTPAVTVDDLKAMGAWMTDEEFAAAVAASRNSRTYTTAEVVAHLRSLG